MTVNSNRPRDPLLARPILILRALLLPALYSTQSKWYYKFQSLVRIRQLIKGRLTTSVWSAGNGQWIMQ